MDNTSFDFATLLGRQAPNEVQPKPQGWLDKLSRGFDTALNWTGVPQQFGQAGEAIGSTFGPKYKEQGYQLGAGLPRSFLELAPQGEVGAGMGLLKMLGIGSAAAHAHEQTGSWGQGAIAGASTGLMPASAALGSRFIGRPLADMVGAKTVEGIAGDAPGRLAGIAERIADYTGANAGAVINQEAARQASSLAAGTGLQNPVSGENLFNVGMGNLPFAALHAKSLIEGPGAGAPRSASSAERMQEAVQPASELESKKMEIERKYMDTVKRDPSPTVELPSPVHVVEPLAPKVEQKNLPDWAREEMLRRGLDPSRPLNDIDVSNPSVIAAIKSDPTLSVQQKEQILKTGSPKATLGGEPVLKPTFADYVAHEQKVLAEQRRLMEMMPQTKERKLLMAPKPEQSPESAVKELNRTIEASKPLVEQPIVNTQQGFDVAKALNEVVDQLRESYDNPHEIAQVQKMTDGRLQDIYTQHLQLLGGLGNERTAVERTFATVQSELNDARRLASDKATQLTDAQQTQQDAQQAVAKLKPDEQVTFAKILHESSNEASPQVQNAVYRAALSWVNGEANSGVNLETHLRSAAKFASMAGNKEDKYGFAKLHIEPSTSEEGHTTSIEEKLDHLANQQVSENPIAQEVSNKSLLPVLAHIRDRVDERPFTDKELVSKGFRDPELGAKRLNVIMERLAYPDQVSKEEAVEAGGFGGEKQFDTFVRTKALPFLREYFKSDMPQLFPDFEHSALEKRMGGVGNAVLSTNAFFSRYGEKLFGPGESTEKELFVRTATRIASLFPGVTQTRVGELIGYKVRGVYVPKSNQVLINQENQGDFAFDSLKVLGHEFVHGVQEAFITNKLSAENKETFSKFREWGASLETEEKANVLNALYASVYPKELRELDINKNRFKQMVDYSSSSNNEFEAEVGGLFALGLAQTQQAKFNDLSEYIKFSPQAFVDFAKMNYVNLNDSVNAVAAMHQLTGEEHQALKGMQENLKKLAKTTKEVDSASKALADIQARTSPENYLKMVQEASAPTRTQKQLEAEWLADNAKLYPDFQSIANMASAAVGFGPDKENLFGIEPGFYDRNLVPMGQLAEKYPMLRPVFDLAIGFESLSHKFATMALAPFMTKKANGKMVFDETHSDVSKIVNTPGASDAFNRIHLEKNELIRDGKVGQDSVLNDSQMRQRTAHLSPEAQEAVMNITRATEKSMPLVWKRILAFREDSFASQFSHILITNEGWSSQFAIDKGQALWKAFNPEQLPQGSDPLLVAAHQKASNEVLNKELAVLQPKTAQGILSHYNAIKTPWEKFIALGNDKPGFSPEVRLGRYELSYKSSVPSTNKNPMAPTFTAFNTRAELEARMASLKGRSDIDPASVHAYDKVDRQNSMAGWNKDVAGTWADVEKASFESLKNKLAPDVYDLVAKNYHPGEAIMKEVASQGLSKHFMQRKLVAGREDLDMLQGILNYIPKMAYGLSKGYAKEQLGLHLRDTELVQNPKILQLAQDYMGSQLDAPPDGKVVRGIKDTIFHYFLGANLSSLFVVGSHSLAVLAPWLTRQGAGLVGSYRLMGKANAELVSLATTGQLSDPVMQQELSKAEQKGLIGKGIMNEFTNNEDVQFTNLRNFATNNGELSSTAKLLAKPLYWYNQFTRGMFNGVAEHNSRVAWLSGYMLAKERGLSPEARVTFAERTATSGALVGGKANRPVGLFADAGKYAGAVGLLYSLQSFQAGATASMVRYLQESLGRSGLKGSELSQARWALGQMVVTQTAMAGAFGLPLAGAMTGIAQQLFPGLDVKKTVRETLRGLTGDNQSMGNLLGDVANNGIVGAMLPFDPSNRITLGNTLGVSPESGFHVENLFGPTGSIVANLVKGTQAAASGQWSQSAEDLVPQGWKNVVRLANHNGDFLDSSGRKVFEPTDVERFFQGIGLRPTRLARIQEEQKILQRSDEAAKRDLQNFHQEQAQRLGQGDFVGVRKALIDRQGVDQNYDARAGLRRVVELAQERLQVRDLTRGGPTANIDRRSQVASMFGQQERPSEVQLLMQRKQMEQAVGIPGVGQVTSAELSHAQMIDHLMRTQPGITRQQAGQLVEHMFRQRGVVQ